MKKQIFLSLLMPYPIRSIKAPYLWVFYKQLTSFKSDEIIFVGSKEYKDEPSSFHNRFEINEDNAIFNNYKIPTIEEINKYIFYEFPVEIVDKLSVNNQYNTNKVFSKLLTQNIEDIENYIEKLLIELSFDFNIVGLLLWSNFPSIKKIASKYNIPVIHNELGAFRKPYYLQMAYFDFSGVNGNTESLSRFFDFKHNFNLERIYSLDEIKEILLNVDYEFTSSLNHLVDFGIALQVEDDSNILAYSNGFDSISLIRWVKDNYKNKTILIREHPASHLSYKKFGNIDFSENSISFINKCDFIVTINSSVALEALLYNKNVKILGDSPFAFINELSNDKEKLLAINFAIFGYMIPYELLFNYDYYLWRLSKPSEKEILDRHLTFYKQKILTRVKEKIIINDNYDFFIQLFISKNIDFTEESSIKYPVLQITEIQRFEFDLKDFGNIKNLRLDPLNDSCVVNISQIYLVLEDDLQIDLKSNIQANTSSHHGDSYFFEFFDPTIYFKDVDFKSLSIKKFVIELLYNHIAKDAVHVCANQISIDKNYMIETKDQIIQSQNQELETKDQIIQSQNQELETKDQIIQSQNQELETKDQIIQSQNQELETKDQIIQSQNQELETKDQIIQSQNQELETKDQIIQSQNQELETKDQIIQSQNQELETKDQIIQSQNQELETKDQIIQSQNQELETKDQIIQSQNQELETKDQIIQSQNQELETKDQIIQSQNQELETKDQIIQSQNQELETKDQIIQSQNQELETKDQIIQSQNQELETKDQIIQSQNQELETKDQIIQSQNQELETKDQIIQSQNQELETKDQIIQSQNQELETKDQIIQSQNQELETKDQIIQSQNQELETKDQIIQSQNQELETKDQIIQSQNQELETKDQIIQSQNQELETKEQIIRNLNDELISIYMSKSWKITRLLRNLMRKIKR